MALQRMSAYWWQSYKLVEVSVDNKMYTQGYASGEGCNCLTDTLRQMLNIISNTKRVRMELDKTCTTGPGRIRPGDFLELQHHWKDVIDLLFRYNEMDLPLTPSGGPSWSDIHKVFCVDMMHLGQGDVAESLSLQAKSESFRSSHTLSESGSFFQTDIWYVFRFWACRRYCIIFCIIKRSCTQQRCTTSATTDCKWQQFTA